MSVNPPVSFEVFLLEDMVLMLANLRGSLGWLSDPAGDGRDEIARHAGLERLDRQLEGLETRARDLCAGLRASGRDRPRAFAPVATPPTAPAAMPAAIPADWDDLFAAAGLTGGEGKGDAVDAFIFETTRRDNIFADLPGPGAGTPPPLFVSRRAG